MTNLFKTVATSLMAACLCCGCPAQTSPKPAQYQDNKDSSLKLCVLPEAIEADQTLPEIADAVAVYWTGQGYPMRYTGPEQGCNLLFEVKTEALTDAGWGSKEAQTFISRGVPLEYSPALTRFRKEWWVDPTTTQEIKAGLAAHEVGHVLGFPHDESPTGKLMSPIVTEDVAQATFGGML